MVNKFNCEFIDFFIKNTNMLKQKRNKFEVLDIKSLFIVKITLFLFLVNS